MYVLILPITNGMSKNLSELLYAERLYSICAHFEGNLKHVSIE